ncbi:glycosyltransferase family 4 protein [Rhizorhabdus dicambivorans]|uniref:Glycosyl transferase family 1 n=1 Tax=Rhizorhabdus dicambivorans TaxID=1850238 RepID=A0A2A4FVB4_9SPHN|nr:glycosyltransferase family 4 protein [Rhizorhabdus dicambivorans]ATE63590.1 glycosyl transferase family 1 [Rhizorhabdus dicambivorans]PCE42716.1 glycosyl transferase family 1 [Rhizorhabdus dicambivorans]
MFHDPSRFDRSGAAAPRGRIWLVSRAFGPDTGSGAAYARAMATAYAELGWSLSLFVRSSAGRRRIEQDTHRLRDVGSRHGLALQIRLLCALFAAWFRGPLPAAIHACTWRAAIPALPFAVPLIVTIHGREIARPQGSAFRLMRFVLDRCTRIVAVSETARALLIERLPHLAGRCVVARGGTSPMRAADRGAILSRGTGPARIITIGRLLPRKNIASALFAVRTALHAGHALSYRIAGDGPDRARLQELIDDLGLSEHVMLLGQVDDAELQRLQAEADIFLHPQIALEQGADVEGFGVGVADAMANGLLCIVGREGGPAELVRDGETGFVVDGRSREAISRALDAALRHPALRTAMGLRARQWTSGNLSWRRHGQLCLDELQTLPAPVAAPSSVRIAA